MGSDLPVFQMASDDIFGELNRVLSRVSVRSEPSLIPCRLGPCLQSIIVTFPSDTDFRTVLPLYSLISHFSLHIRKSSWRPFTKRPGPEGVVFDDT